MADINSVITNNEIQAELQNNVSQNINSNTEINNLQGEITDTGNITSSVTGTSFGAELENSENLTGSFTQPTLPTGHYIHIAYKQNENSSSLTFNYTKGLQWLGICINDSLNHPQNAESYVWHRIVGEQGEKGDTGPQGPSGTATITIDNPLQYRFTLSSNNWEYKNRNDNGYFIQKIKLTDGELIDNLSETLANTLVGDTVQISESENSIPQEILKDLKKLKILLENIKLSNNVTPLVDIVVNENISLGLNQIKEWGKVNRAYIDFDEKEDCYIYFECYDLAPNTDFNVVMKVI